MHWVTVHVWMDGCMDRWVDESMGVVGGLNLIPRCSPRGTIHRNPSPTPCSHTQLTHMVQVQSMQDVIQSLASDMRDVAASIADPPPFGDTFSRTPAGTSPQPPEPPSDPWFGVHVIVRFGQRNIAPSSPPPGWVPAQPITAISEATMVLQCTQVSGWRGSVTSQSIQSQPDALMLGALRNDAGGMDAVSHALMLHNQLPRPPNSLEVRLPLPLFSRYCRDCHPLTTL